VKPGAVNAVPHRLNPLTTEHPEHDHKGMEKVFKVPARYRLEEFFRVIISEQLHAHDREDEDDYCENEA